MVWYDADDKGLQNAAAVCLFKALPAQSKKLKRKPPFQKDPVFCLAKCTGPLGEHHS